MVTGKATSAEGHGHDDAAQVMGRLFRELEAALPGGQASRGYGSTEDGQEPPHGSSSDVLAVRFDVQNALRMLWRRLWIQRFSVVY